MKITDYGNSYVTWTGKTNENDNRKPGHMPWANSVRILLDSRCWITSEDSGETREYNLISPCRTEWMYRSDVLWQEPNYEFAGIYSETDWMAGHIKAGDTNEFGGDWREAHPIEGRFDDFKTVVRHYSEAVKLENDEQVVQATMDFLPIVARTEVWSDDGKTRATIEYPIKTMNVQLERNRMQVDTGPLIYPDFASGEESEIRMLNFAFVCYNVDDVAEFVLRGPTPVMRDGKEVGTYIDYSDVRRVPMKNTFYAAKIA
jgi:hypothetical protein